MDKPTTNPEERTRRNVCDSDGTIIIVPDWPFSDKIVDGTLLALEEAQRLGKPFLIINFANKHTVARTTQEWTYQNNIEVLNVAGPRESSCPGIQKKAYNLLRKIFNHGPNQ